MPATDEFVAKPFEHQGWKLFITLAIDLEDDDKDRGRIDGRKIQARENGESQGSNYAKPRHVLLR